MKTSKNNILISVQDLSLHIGENKIFSDADFSIYEKERIGLVGRNGSGKSTLLKILSGEIIPDEGKIDKKRDLTLGILSQNFTLDENKTILENIFDSNEKTEDLIGKLEKFIKNLNLKPKETLVGNLSGGEKRRVALIKSIIFSPELLILDEPTNHLDTESIEWLEKFLKSYSGACLFVTHDRYFLDKIATTIVEIDRGNLYNHTGNYTKYLESKSKRFEIQTASEKNRQKFLQKELEWVRKSPKGRLAKNEGRVEKYHREASKEVLEKELDVSMIIPPAPRMSNRILDIRNLSYEIENKVLIKDLNLDFQEGMKVGVVGRNGVGKSTLLKLILGKLTPSNGVIDVAARTEINYIDQEKVVPDEENTVFKEVGEGREFIKFGDKMLPVKEYLKRFLFTHKRVFAQIKNLSGGERSRLLLAKILKNGGNFLILDEPTNDLDLNTLRILEEALINFGGCLIIVSHDRYFLNRVCTHILGFEGEGKIFLNSGDYDFYIKNKLDRQKNTSNGFSIEQENLEIPKAEPSVAKITREELNELRKIERSISSYENKIKVLEQEFIDPEFHKRDVENIKKLNLELKNLKTELERMYEKWEILESRRSG